MGTRRERLVERVARSRARDGLGEDVAHQVVAARGKRHRERAAGPTVELAGSARPRTGPAAQPPELDLEQPLRHQPVEVEARGVERQVEGAGRLLAPDRVGLAHDVLVEPAAGLVDERPDAGGLGEVHQVILKQKTLDTRA